MNAVSCKIQRVGDMHRAKGWPQVLKGASEALTERRASFCKMTESRRSPQLTQRHPRQCSWPVSSKSSMNQ